ncbi:unnamed protein product [Auanema sp. JU1783]|nr:unnamed protein product [Auanema sp. JU1783]
MAAPVPFRTHDNKYAPSFPPVVYYRDTYGFDKDNKRESTTDGSDSDSIATKSTIRTTINNIHPVSMYESTGSRRTNMTQSYQVEQVTTNRILTANPRTLLTLALVAFASALQLLIFAIISIFYDGCPYYISIIIIILLLLNTFVIFIFTKCRPTRTWLILSCICSSLSFVQSISLFFWTAHLINNEDKYIENVGAHDYRIITSTRIAMYSLQMVFAPIHAIASAICAYVLYKHLSSMDNDKITKAYFLTEAPLGHQKILVPIELRQVTSSSDDDIDQASIGVQTSGTTRTHI